MSGQLVGEIIAAQTELRRRGLNKSAFMALLAIAEKCPAETREARVRWDHIRDGMFGACLNTARAAIQRLVDCGVVVVVRPGYGNRHQTYAPTYQIKTLVAQPKTGASSPLEQPKTGAATDLELPTFGLDVPTLRSRATNPDAPTSGDSSRDGNSDGNSDGTTNYISRADKGTRLPTGWEPPTAVMTELQNRWPHINLVEALEEFHDYWCAKPGASGRKTDWAATFRNRVRALDKRRLDKAERDNRYRSNGTNGHSQKIDDVGTAAATALQTLGITTTPAINGATQKEIR